MVQTQTILNVADNTGAKKALCIKILGNNRKYGQIGDFLICCIKRALPNMPVKKSAVVKSVLIRSKKTLVRTDGHSLKFDANEIVLLNTDNTPKGSRIFGPILRELRKKKLIKIISLADNII
jgi:large subunit ribosomal protein L14